jgi:membrane protease YdiL (CAAX protease family)
MKDAARLFGYFAATILIGALLAPVLFLAAQWLATCSQFSFLAKFDFELFFHRALLIAAALLLWPLLRSTRVRTISDLQLAPNPKWGRDLLIGFLFAALPLLCCGSFLFALHIFAPRHVIAWPAFPKIIASSITVPAIEEVFFRGLLLGLLLRTGRPYIAIFVTSALYSMVHFLKAPERTSTIVTWTSGFNSIAHSFSQFGDPFLLLASFTTLFLIGWILADARLSTRSLWMPIGLHAGWIFASGAFNKIAHRERIALPWLGKNLLVGIVPLIIVCLTWAIMRGWLKHGIRKT